MVVGEMDSQVESETMSVKVWKDRINDEGRWGYFSFLWLVPNYRLHDCQVSMKSVMPQKADVFCIAEVRKWWLRVALVATVARMRCTHVDECIV